MHSKALLRMTERIAAVSSTLAQRASAGAPVLEDRRSDACRRNVRRLLRQECILQPFNGQKGKIGIVNHRRTKRSCEHDGP